jgi:acetylornithine deacetylase
VPDRCTVELDLRPLPGMSVDGLIDRVRQRIEEAAGRGAGQLELVSMVPALSVDRGAPIHAQLREQLGQKGDHSVSYATDGGWLQRLGLQCAICGPGSIEVAHRPNEHLPRRDLARGRRLLEQLIARCCT